MFRNLESSSELTEFAPLSPEPEDNPGIGYLFSKFFKRNNSEAKPQAVPADVTNADLTGNADCQWQDAQAFKESLSESSNISEQYKIETVEGRSLPNVLKRISNLLALKNTGLQSYKNTELKQYWMPDSVSKECYDCGEKFTTFRRRHHCRVCGQIFCSRCCNQEIPGKIMGCTGDLRVCTYCGKVVLSYLQSADMGADLSADLRALQEDLQTKFGSTTNTSPAVNASSNSGQVQNSANLTPSIGERDDNVKRKPSVGYQEEKFVQARSYGTSNVDDRSRPVQGSSSLRSLYDELTHPVSGLSTGIHSHRLNTYHSCFTGSEIVDWLMLNSKASIRIQGAAISQALLEAGYIECISHDATDFCDGYTLYSLRTPHSSSPNLSSTMNAVSHSENEELWSSSDMQIDTATTDSESECPVSEVSFPSSASLFRLDLNLEDSTVHISRPLQTSTHHPKKGKPNSVNVNSGSETHSNEGLGDKCVRAVFQSFRDQSRETTRAVNWYKVPVPHLRVDNGEKDAYERMNVGFSQHLQNLLKQLLTSEGLSHSWGDIIIPLAKQVVDMVKPDLRCDTDDMDIRQYIQMKKVGGGSRTDSCIVAGVVCCKNLVHRSMPSRINNPRILLLSCSIVYQRIEGRLMSLEPVMMQEQEYLRHVVARIAALEPDLVLVQRNVSRLAQEYLREKGITLVLNVKPSVLERVARVTKADIVKSIDAQIGRPQLGTCKLFHVKSFITDTGATKTLMFLEGCSSPHLGCTILLRGAPTPELAKLKRVTSWLIFACYNWRLEQSFLMDEFANLPVLNEDAFFEDAPKEKKKKLNSNISTESSIDNQFDPGSVSSPLNENSAAVKLFPYQETSGSTSSVKNAADRPYKVAENISPNVVISDKCSVKNKANSISEHSDKSSSESSSKTSRLSGKDKSLSEEKRINVESVSDFSDPLHLYLNLEDEVFSDNTSGQAFSVSELPQANRFCKALDDTILTISPFLKFNVPYLETEGGRNCCLRRYFPKEIYWSAQLRDQSEPVEKSVTLDNNSKETSNKLQGVKLSEKHPFISAKLTNVAGSCEVQKLLASFRACGGRLPMPSDSILPPTVATTTGPPPVTSPPRPLDALDPAKHQRLAVLFCSYSHASQNAPAFCVNPWIVHMDFYGRNDIPLGAFLERYCFRTSYVCPSDTCDTPMLHHIRRFVHDGGAVYISLKEIESAPPTDDKTILMWSWCQHCKKASPVMPMSSDTWSFSFAKYLELRFHGNAYSCRGPLEATCKHSLHHDYCQFFGYRNIVAAFKYSKIAVWEISLPPLTLITERGPHQQYQAAILEEVKKWALNGYEVFSAILNRLCNLATNGEAISTMKQQLQKEQAAFKLRVEDIQVHLTSPTLEKTDILTANKDNILISLWQLEDSLVLLKRSVAEAVVEWNNRLVEFETAVHAKRREEKNKKNATDKPFTSATGLGEIIEGVISSHFTDTHNVEDNLPVEEKSIPSQLSQCSLHSATDVMDISEISSGSCLEHQDSADEQPIYMSVHYDGNKEYEISQRKVETEKKSNEDDVGNTDLVKGSDSTEFVCTSEQPVTQQGDDCQTRIDDNEHLGFDDGEVISSHIAESTVGAKVQQMSDKMSVKTIFSQLLPAAPVSTPIQCPMSPQEHHCLPLGVTVPVVVYEHEPSSIIAYALSCHDYKLGLEELRSKKLCAADQSSPSPSTKRKSGGSEITRDSPLESSSSAKAGVLSFFRGGTSSGNSNSNISGSSVIKSTECTQNSISAVESKMSNQPDNEESTRTESEMSKSKPMKFQISPHIEVQFSDSCANFIVKIYFSDEFARLRKAIFPAGEEAFIRSMSRCVQWAARGGKSGSNFAKTKDDRFILKEMSRTETHPFMDSAPQYFAYMNSCAMSGSPTLLGKIVGVYRVIYRNATSNATFRSNLLVMENLFHGRSVKHKFDLKGSVRNRLVNPLEQEGEIVLLDENLINMTCDSPLYILPHSKTVLMQAIHNDTQFLSSQCVMDYSLLVGLDENSKELVVGIIDYIRTFTWDKKIETMVKKSGLLGGQGKQPTIVSPEEYRDRFIAAMHRYFLPVPDRWTGLGKGLEF